MATARGVVRRLDARWRGLQLVALQVAVLLLLAPAAAPAECDAYPSYDRPDLARPGNLAVGRRVWSLDAPTGPPEAPARGAGRRLELLVWYPAAIDGCAGASAHRQSLVRHAWRPLPVERIEFEVPSAATPDAPAGAGGPYPLVVLSHGLLGWASALSYLGEHLASRGYVVAAIDHADDLTTAPDPLQGAIAMRSRDQAAAIAALHGWSGDPRHVLHGRIDVERTAIVGYSMGGYGALELTQGCGAGGSQPGCVAGLRAVVAIAPWGAQSSVARLDRAAVGRVSVPMLFIVGDHDDISGFDDGVGSLFRAAVGAERWMLVYRNARHNVGGYPLPGYARDASALQTFFVDPVWRIERIQAVNRHFVTAFLDLAVKGEASRRAWLEPATRRSNDGEWPAAAGNDPRDAVADGTTAPRFWRGFQRRSALGLELLQLKAGEFDPPR